MFIKYFTNTENLKNSDEVMKVFNGKLKSISFYDVGETIPGIRFSTFLLLEKKETLISLGVVYVAFKQSLVP